MPPHAIHGVAFDRPWTVTGPAEITLELDDLVLHVAADQRVERREGFIQKPDIGFNG